MKLYATVTEMSEYDMFYGRSMFWRLNICMLDGTCVLTKRYERQAEANAAAIILNESWKQ